MLKFLILSLVSFFPLTLCGNSGLFMEENSLNLQDSMLFNTTTENDFNQVINKLQITYNVISQNTGKPITITGEWKNSTPTRFVAFLKDQKALKRKLCYLQTNTEHNITEKQFFQLLKQMERDDDEQGHIYVDYQDATTFITIK